jgi:hypothetical protein
MTTTEITETNTVEAEFDPAKAEAFGGQMMGILARHIPQITQAFREGGGVPYAAFGAPPPDPLAEATGALRTIRVGGGDFAAKRLAAALEDAGCAAVRALPRSGPVPLEYVIGQRAPG